MTDRHWDAISEKVGAVVKPDENFSFTTCIDLGLLNHIDFCVTTGEKAAKEF